MIEYLGGPREDSADLPSTALSESTNSTSANSGSARTGGIPSGFIGAGASTAVGLSPLGDMPGLPGAVGPAVSAAVKGESAEDIGYAALAGGITSIAREKLGELIGPFAGPAISVAKEAFSESPNLGRAAVRGTVPSTVGVMVGAVNPLAGIVAGTLTGYATEKSLLDGYLGDMVDSRSFEDHRDRAEDQGYSVDDTAGMAAREGLARGSGYTGIGPSFDDANKGTPYGNLKDASVNALGDPETLGSYAEKNGAFGNDSDSNDSSSSGSGIGGFSGADLGKGGDIW